ncbi:hypothetical protein FA13DRAFT_1739847 [Coprinellus micaceus]|uniref:Uncharacterized protein n=1 Tax=Coprinellus micaceus TaxID=71717 RepID=A0A4Y7SPW3_COPMI|nr:hypothetical protein FA13DRAFT_1739847 [Coprinellus micaceus]
MEGSAGDLLNKPIDTRPGADEGSPNPCGNDIDGLGIGNLVSADRFFNRVGTIRVRTRHNTLARLCGRRTVSFQQAKDWKWALTFTTAHPSSPGGTCSAKFLPMTA